MHVNIPKFYKRYFNSKQYYFEFQILPFEDNLCVREPCLNFELCLTVLKFGNASSFINSDTVLFRPIYPVTTFACQCPHGFTGICFFFKLIFIY